jgi:hypothetical protein
LSLPRTETELRGFRLIRAQSSAAPESEPASLFVVGVATRAFPIFWLASLGYEVIRIQ